MYKRPENIPTYYELMLIKERLSMGESNSTFDQKILGVYHHFDQYIVFEDESLLVINKPDRMLTHRPPNSQSRIGLEELVRIRYGDKAGCLHRLDADTSGILFFAKDRTTEFAQRMFAQFRLKERETLHKHYLFLVQGHMRPPQPDGKVELLIETDPDNNTLMRAVGRRRSRRGNIAGAELAVSYFNPLYHFTDVYGKKYSLVEARLITGKKHQLRVTSKSLGHPIIGDNFYNPDQTAESPRLMLHAWRSAFTHPITQERHLFESPIPLEMFKFMANMKSVKQINEVLAFS